MTEPDGAAGMWKHVHRSVIGTSHRAGGLPCQDASRARTVLIAGETYLLVAASDGAGSASRAEVGATAACRLGVAAMLGHLRRGGRPGGGDGADAAAFTRRVHEGLNALAARIGCQPSDLACTVLLGMVGSAGGLFAHVGDGAIVTDAGDGPAVTSWPDNGEYANTTSFITQPSYADLQRCVELPGPIRAVALLTDGLQTVALDPAARAAHPQFFGPVFDAVRRPADAAALAADLAAFLDGPRVNARTDDDKTLVLAVWLPEGEA